MSIPEHARTPRGVWLLRFVATAVIAVSVVGSFGGWYPLFDLCSHFRFQYFALLAVLAILLWHVKSPRWAGVALLACAHNAVLIGPYYLPANSASPPSESDLSIVSFNVHASNRRSAEVLEYLRRTASDVVVLIEVDRRWLSELEPLHESYPHRVIVPDDGPFGIALFSKLPIGEYSLLRTGGSSSTAICAELDFNGRTIGFVAAHPVPPLTPSMYRDRNHLLARIGEHVQSIKLPSIVAGDFNATPWCVGFDPLRKAGLTDTALGCGVRRTWNSHIPFMGIPIDHVVATKEVATLRRAVGPHCGSDHYAVEAILRLSP
jgi:endonuclease/exonuclease/phosphatase (EEP) superfamily protein YafD